MLFYSAYISDGRSHSDETFAIHTEGQVGFKLFSSPAGRFQEPKHIVTSSHIQRSSTLLHLRLMSFRIIENPTLQTEGADIQANFFNGLISEPFDPTNEFSVSTYNHVQEQPPPDDRLQSGQFTHFSARSGQNIFPPLVGPSLLESAELGIPGISLNDSTLGCYEEEQLPDSFIDICIIISFPNVAQNPVWSYLNIAVNVTQNYEKDPSDDSLPPKNSAQTSQQLIPNGARRGRHLKEINMRINIKNTLQTRNRVYQYQLVCSAAEDNHIREQIGISWNKMEVCTIVTNRATSQLLSPITKTIFRENVISRIGDNFLGSFAFDGHSLYHVGPIDTSMPMTSGEFDQTRGIAPPLTGINKIITVDKSDRVVGPRGSRGARPFHRLTGDLLMTREQAEKIVEIRERWRGLTARQRRCHVTQADFYPLLTLNRDEAAKVLAVCTTWFKDIIRLQGILVWPGRPLRKSGTQLEELKANLVSAKAAIQFVQPHTAAHQRHENKIQNLEREIANKLHERLDIVRKIVSARYFEKFIKDNGQQFLNPQWDTLPPPLPPYAHP